LPQSRPRARGSLDSPQPRWPGPLLSKERIRWQLTLGEIRKHGNTLIGTLRKTYGPDFAKGCAEDEKLSDILATLGEPSLSHLIRDHETGKLEQICRGQFTTT